MRNVSYCSSEVMTDWTLEKLHMVDCIAVRMMCSSSSTQPSLAASVSGVNPCQPVPVRFSRPSHCLDPMALAHAD